MCSVGEMTHELRNVVVEGNHAAYEELCTYPDGTQVLGIAMLDLENGRIRRQTTVEVWDEEKAGSPVRVSDGVREPTHDRVFTVTLLW